MASRFVTGSVLIGKEGVRKWLSLPPSLLAVISALPIAKEESCSAVPFTSPLALQAWDRGGYAALFSRLTVSTSFINRRHSSSCHGKATHCTATGSPTAPATACSGGTSGEGLPGGLGPPAAFGNLVYARGSSWRVGRLEAEPCHSSSISVLGQREGSCCSCDRNGCQILGSVF